MAQVKVTFEDANDPGNPGCERFYADDTTMLCTDHGKQPVSAVQVGWKIRYDWREPWMTVLTVE